MSPRGIAAVLVNKADTAQWGPGGNSSTHLVLWLLAAAQCLSYTGGTAQDIIKGFVVLAAFEFVLWDHLCPFCVITASLRHKDF